MTEATISLRCPKELKRWTQSQAARAGIAEGKFVRTVLERARAESAGTTLTWDEILAPGVAMARKIKASDRLPNPVVAQRQEERKRYARRLR